MSQMATGTTERPRPQGKTTLGGGGLRVYKPGQGYYTRVGTAVGGGLLVIAGGLFLFSEFGAYVDPKAGYALPLQYGVSVAFILILSVALYWAVGLNRRTNDFFIATEGEMKKVSWSSRRDIIRSTKVVIIAVLILGAFIFAADLLFMMFFSTIGVLKGAPGIEKMLGLGS